MNQNNGLNNKFCSKLFRVLQEKTLYTIQEEGKLIFLKSHTTGTEVCHENGILLHTMSTNFVPDGLSFIILRHLVIHEFEGTFETSSVLINNDTFRSTYTFERAKWILVNNIPIQGIQVTRTVFYQNNTPETISMMYLTTGHLIYHEWMGLDIVLHIYPSAPIPPEGFLINKNEYWKNDLEMMRLFQEIKEKRKLELKNFLENNSDCMCLLKDCLMMMQQLKNQNILDFVIEYFLNLPNNFKTSVES